MTVLRSYPSIENLLAHNNIIACINTRMIFPLLTIVPFFRFLSHPFFSFYPFLSVISSSFPTSFFLSLVVSHRLPLSHIICPCLFLSLCVPLTLSISPSLAVLTTSMLSFLNKRNNNVFKILPKKGPDHVHIHFLMTFLTVQGYVSEHDILTNSTVIHRLYVWNHICGASFDKDEFVFVHKQLHTYLRNLVTS